MTTRRLRGGCWFSFPWYCRSTARSKMLEPVVQNAYGGFRVTAREAGARRVFRGGSWISYARYVRSAYRYWFEPGGRGAGLGFRICIHQPKETTND